MPKKKLPPMNAKAAQARAAKNLASVNAHQKKIHQDEPTDDAIDVQKGQAAKDDVSRFMAANDEFWRSGDECNITIDNEVPGAYSFQVAGAFDTLRGVVFEDHEVVPDEDEEEL